MLKIPIPLNFNPPHGVAWEAVHPSGRGRDVPRQIQAFRNDGNVAEYRADRRHFEVHIANPDEPVTLDSVPEIFLYVEVYGIVYI